MSNLDQIEKFIRQESDSLLANYVIPGLESFKASGVKVRMFDMTREQVSHIAPHSHRFNFACMVLSGVVQNILWKPQPKSFGAEVGDLFVEKVNKYMGSPGQYEAVSRPLPVRYAPVKKSYGPGECYGMKHDEVHSIIFEDNAKVLFLEGDDVVNENIVLVPYDSRTGITPIDATQPWMFRPVPLKAQS